MGDASVQVKEVEREAQGNGQRNIEEEFAESDTDITPAEAEVEADASQLADGEEAVEAGIEQGELAEETEAMGPGGLEPAEVDGEAEREEDEVIEKMAALVGIELRREPEQDRNKEGNEEIDEQPAQGKGVGGKADKKPGKEEDGGNGKAGAEGQGLGSADAAAPGEREGKDGRQEKDQRHDRRGERKGKRHDLILPGETSGREGAD
jgi:hypothetical protein